MEKNVALMSSYLKDNAVAEGRPLENFAIIARIFSYSGRQTSAHTKVKEAQPPQNDMLAVPDYEIHMIWMNKVPRMTLQQKKTHAIFTLNIEGHIISYYELFSSLSVICK